MDLGKAIRELEVEPVEWPQPQHVEQEVPIEQEAEERRG